MGRALGNHRDLAIAAASIVALTIMIHAPLARAAAVPAPIGLRLTPLAVDSSPVMPASGDEADPRRAVPDLPSPPFDGSVIAALILAGVAAGFLGRRHVGRRREKALSASLSHAVRMRDRVLSRAGVATIGLVDRAVRVSPAFCDLVGYAEADPRIASPIDLAHPEDAAAVGAMLDAIRAGGADAELTHRLIHRDGRVLWVVSTFANVAADHRMPEILVTVRGIDDAMRLEDQRRESAREIGEARALANDAVRAKADFLAMMSHEIHTPLNAILGFADLLLERHELSAPARRDVERIKAGGYALLIVVKDILDVSQAESGTLALAPRPFALPLLVDECISLVQASAIAKNLSLSVDLADRFPTGLLGDDARLRQILLNLLANAIKFTAVGGIAIRIAYDRTCGADTILFEVSDTGIGIAPGDVPALFQRFSQLDGSIRRKRGGAGLGLALSRSLVELMGGTIGVDSEPGIGSTFWFKVSLPRASIVLETEREPAPTLGGLSILVAEDVAINQELVKAILQARGHRVDVVGDGAVAIMAAADTSYDLVLMDLQMPSVDGYTATRAIRAMPAPACHVPIVAMTANVLRENVAEAYAAGMNDFIAKPLSIDALLKVVDKVAVEARQHAA